MLFRCFHCEWLGFTPSCPDCGEKGNEYCVPLDPEFYPEFQYKSQGLIKDIFIKRKTERALREKLDAVLQKYKKFEKPYFVNYMQLVGPMTSDSARSDEYSALLLFHNVLLRLGFEELMELPNLTAKLVRTTAFRFQYRDFIRRVEQHISPTLYETLRSWIKEQGAAFREYLPMLLHYLWKNKMLIDEIKFNNCVPLVDHSELKRIRKLCEEIYFDVLVTRFKIKLENFDPSLFVTIYAVDAMSGHEFEDFLAKLFMTLGYDVQRTKRTGDQGADLFVEKFGNKIVIQAKNYSENVGNAAVQQALAAKAFYGCDQAMVVTNRYFTPSAKELADSAGVKLIDRRELKKYIDEYNSVIMEQMAYLDEKDMPK